jgi:prophage regulatory protein
MNTSVDSSDRIIRIREVIEMTGLSRSSIYFLIKKGNFPAQVKLSTRSSGWFRKEIKDWVDTRPRAA